MEKVLKMAEGIDIGEVRTYELVPSRKLKRYHSPSDSEYTCLCVKGDASLSLFGGHYWEHGDNSLPRSCLRESQHGKLKRSNRDVIC